MSLPPRPRPKVLIVGAGLGGLMLGILLDKIGVPYHIYERSLEVKALGALMSFSGNVLRLFEQLGMLEEVLSISIPSANSTIYSEDMDLLADLGIPGYESLIKILCSDDTSYEGDILVGADGAYSTIRREMHARMEQEGLLSEADKQDFTVPYVCMVGTTTARDPDRYPELKDDVAHLHHVIGNSTRYSWTTITISKNRICWSVMAQIKSESEANQLRLSSTEWGPEAAESMIKEVHDFPIKLGGGAGVLGDIIDATPPDVVSKVMLEEKLFEQWSHGRIVLIGDEDRGSVASLPQKVSWRYQAELDAAAAHKP
ncbi:hypothetical protein KI688_009952 [Linnemannia hyalina]|uniref:FAD-binding domain-containing protein n=1 Tax=Linnemannia hyalina TaxID=64524 RepID=A0A9P7Y0G8_9FUNG|nr:hypothetical protein KI688_009952 [Linnemannia hyalina]